MPLFRGIDVGDGSEKSIREAVLKLNRELKWIFQNLDAQNVPPLRDIPSLKDVKVEIPEIDLSWSNIDGIPDDIVFQSDLAELPGLQDLDFVLKLSMEGAEGGFSTVYVQPTKPENAKKGDQWIDTSEVAAQYRYFTLEEQTKLDNIEEEANKYLHPDSHPADMIDIDDTGEFYTSVNVEDALQEVGSALEGIDVDKTVYVADWDSTVEYSIGDACYFDGNFYESTSDNNLDNQPDVSDWEVITGSQTIDGGFANSTYGDGMEFDGGGA